MIQVTTRYLPLYFVIYKKIYIKNSKIQESIIYRLNVLEAKYMRLELLQKKNI